MFRVRQKISYSAFTKRMTVAEILVDSVHRTFDLFMKNGCLKIKMVSKPLLEYFNAVL